MPTFFIKRSCKIQEISFYDAEFEEGDSARVKIIQLYA
jgi:hypothetical protein